MLQKFVEHSEDGADFDIKLHNSTHLKKKKKTQGGGEKVVEKKLHKNVVNNSVGVGMLKIVKCC